MRRFKATYWDWDPILSAVQTVCRQARTPGIFIPRDFPFEWQFSSITEQSSSHNRTVRA